MPLGSQEKLISSQAEKESRSVISRVKSVLKTSTALGAIRDVSPSDLQEFQTWTSVSEVLRVTKCENDQGDSSIQLEEANYSDALFWLLYFFPFERVQKSPSKIFPELSGFLMYASGRGDSVQIVNALEECWNHFEKMGFPPKLGASGMVQR